MERALVPVPAIYQAPRPFEEVAPGYVIRSDRERAALRQEYAATRALYTRWLQDLRAGAPTARVVELTGANLFMFPFNEAGVLQEVGAFATTLTTRSRATDIPATCSVDAPRVLPQDLPTKR